MTADPGGKIGANLLTEFYILLILCHYFYAKIVTFCSFPDATKQQWGN